MSITHVARQHNHEKLNQSFLTERICLQNATISKKHCNRILEMKPALRNDTALRRMFVWLSTGRQLHDSDSGHILMSRELLAAFMNEDPKHCRTQTLVDRFRAEVPGFEYIDYSHQGHKWVGLPYLVDGRIAEF